MEYRRSSHSLYDLKYHVVFCAKDRYRVLTGIVATRARELIREICTTNDVIPVHDKKLDFWDMSDIIIA
jgi:putative transposase